MGYLAMEKLLDVKNGKQLQDPIFTGLDVCTPENAASCLGQK
jgi:ribose transport system substrate-binding protein